MSNFIYLVSAILFIFSIRGLSSPKTARLGNYLGICGMALAILTALTNIPTANLLPIIAALTLGGIIGTISGQKVKMTALPQMIAVFNGLGGGAAVFLSVGEVLSGNTHPLTACMGSIIGALAFSGSMVAFAKLQGILSGKSFTFKMQHFINLFLSFAVIGLSVAYTFDGNNVLFMIMTAVALILGVLLVLPIGGADMPIVISVLNAYSGWAAVGVGFMMNQILLIITGTIVGAGGSILSYVMTKAVNSSLWQIMLGQKGKNAQDKIAKIEGTAKAGSPIDVAFIMENAEKIIIVPGYGMAAARAQHALKEMADTLRNKYKVDVKFAIHPVAGRMPGHMNVLLAEANVPYDEIFEMEDINREFSSADVAYVIGANDITNPLAKSDASSPIYGMPVLDVGAAKNVFFVKRSLGSGYAGVENPLFYQSNTTMLYGDAKVVTESIVKELEK